MRRLRIFVSSPGDVQKERQVARAVISRLAAEFSGRVVLDPYFWEYEPMRITAGFQAQIEPPSDFDIVVCILWSRLGTPLQAPDGQHYTSGTEYEVETAVASHRERGYPDVLVYHNQTPAQIRRSPRAAREQAYRQFDALENFLEKLALDPVTRTVKGAISRYVSLAEFEERLEHHLRRLIEVRLEPGGGDDAARPAITWLENPFRGLELFDFQHETIFFGRTRAIGEVIDSLRRQAHRLEEQAQARATEHERQRPDDSITAEETTQPRPAAFVLISAMSGAGKSSLVRAGVLPLLTRPGVIEGVGLWRRSVMRPSGSLGDLFDSLAQALIQPEALPELTSDGKDARQIAALLRRSPTSVDLLISQALAHAADLLRKDEDRQLEKLIESYRNLGQTEDAARCEEIRRSLKARAARLVLVVDQLEEIFALPKFRDAPPATGNFIAALGALAHSGNVFIIATLRSDFFGRCAEYPELMELKQGDGHYDLALPTPQEIGQIIRQPAVAAGLHYETIGPDDHPIKLDEMLRDEAVAHPEALPLLEYCLDGLYQRRLGNLLTYVAYKELGGVEGALAKRAEDVFQTLGLEAQRAFDPVMRRLATASLEKEGLAYTRNWADYDALAALPGAKEFVDAFVGPHARLFITDKNEADKPIVTLTHEALLRQWPRLKDWLGTNSDMLQVKAAVAVAARQWQGAKNDPSYLLARGLQLEKAKQSLRDGYLEQDEAAFVQASIQTERKIVRRRRFSLAVLFGVIAAVAGATSLYGWQRYDQGRLTVDSNAPGARVSVDDLELGLPVKNFALRSGNHMLRAFADEFIDRTRSVTIARSASTDARFWLEKGVLWTYPSPAIQGGFAILPDLSGGPSLIAHNEITRVTFLSTASGKVVTSIPTPTGNWRTFKTINLGDDIGKVVVSGLDQEQTGPELLVIRGTAPPQVLWRWRGSRSGFGTPQSLAIEALPRPDGSADVIVAGRNGHLYVLDGKTGRQINDLQISDQPLVESPLLVPWKSGSETVITVLMKPGDPNHLVAAQQPHLMGMSVRVSDGIPLWRTDLGVGWSMSIPPLQIENHPQVFLSTDTNWRLIDLATGAVHGTGHFPAPLVSGPTVADLEGNGKPLFVFEFADPAQQMVGVDPSDGAVVWHGPAGLNPRGQPRGLNGLLRTSSGAILVTTDKALTAIDPRSGQIVWSAPGVPRGVLIGDWDGNGPNEILVTISGIGLRCLDEAGQERWTLRLADDVEPRALIKSNDGGPLRDILLYRHAGLISLVHGPSMLWASNASAAIQATPVVAKDASGKAIVVETAPWGNDISLRAFDGAYGNVLWSAKEQFSPNRGVTLADLDGIGQPYVIGVGSRPPNPAVQLYAYRTGDGELVRAKTVGITPTWLSCAPAVADFRGIGKSDVAFSTWDDRSIVMTDGRSGDVLWQFSLGNSTMSGVAAADIDGDGLPDVIAATLDGYAYALRGKDGTLLWKAPIPGGAWSAPVTAALEPNGPPSILITSLSGTLYVLNSRTGETIWTSPGSEAANAVPVTMNQLKVGGHAAVVMDGDRTVILVPAGAAGVIAFDWSTKAELWRSPSGFPVIASPVPVDLKMHNQRGVVVASANGTVWVLALADGKPLWHLSGTLKSVEADPMVADLNGDGVPDILLAGYDFSLRAINGTAIGLRPASH